MTSESNLIDDESSTESSENDDWEKENSLDNLKQDEVSLNRVEKFMNYVL